MTILNLNLSQIIYGVPLYIYIYIYIAGVYAVVCMKFKSIYQFDLTLTSKIPATQAVRPVLRTTCLEGSPVYRDHRTVGWSVNHSVYTVAPLSSVQGPPVYRDHNYLGPLSGLHRQVLYYK